MADDTTYEPRSARDDGWDDHLAAILEARLDRDEDRLREDELRLEADEKILRSSRIVALVAIVLASTLVLAVTGLIIGLLALNRNIDVVANAPPKHDSVTTAALQDGAVTTDKLAHGAVGNDAVAEGAIKSRQLAAGAVQANDVAGNSLTGDQIDEQTLAEVPSATRARTAHDAQALGGLKSSTYLSRVRIQRVASATDTGATKGPVTARCPSGTRIVGGGAAVEGASRGVAIVRSAPNDKAGWVAVADAYDDAGTPWRLVVTAICAAGGG